MDKKEYEKIIKTEFDGLSQKFLLSQMEEFYKVKDLEIKSHKYNVGDFVVLSKDTFLHGFGSNIETFDDYAENGLVSVDFKEKKDKKVRFAISLWHIHKKIDLANYIKFYSGLTVRFDNESGYKIIPYGKIEEFLNSIKSKNYFSFKAEPTMETSFLPSLLKDGQLNNDDNISDYDGCRQMAFIINGREERTKNLFNNNLINEKIPFDVVEKFIRLEGARRDAFKQNRKVADCERIAYILFGIPSNLIEGVFVGRLYEKDKKFLKHIKEKLPNCYICNLDGKVIVQ